METRTSPFNATDSFYLRARVEGISKGRIQNYEFVFKSFSKWLGVKSLDEISRDDMRGYLFHLQEERKLAKPTIALHYDVLHTFFNFCRSEGYIEKSPVDQVKPPRLPIKISVPRSVPMFRDRDITQFWGVNKWDIFPD